MVFFLGCCCYCCCCFAPSLLAVVSLSIDERCSVSCTWCMTTVTSCGHLFSLTYVYYPALDPCRWCGGGGRQIFRKVRGILNKLTIEKFEPLVQQLLYVGINSENVLKVRGSLLVNTPSILHSQSAHTLRNTHTAHHTHHTPHTPRTPHTHIIRLTYRTNTHTHNLIAHAGHHHPAL